MSCSHVLILNRHVFLNTSNCRRGKYSCEWILCGTDIKLGRYCNMEGRHNSADWRSNKPQSQRPIRLQLVVRKTLLSYHTHCTKLYKVESMNRTTFQVEFKGLWQLFDSGPSSKDTTGGKQDIKQPKKTNITSNHALNFQQHMALWHTCTARQQACKQQLVYSKLHERYYKSILWNEKCTLCILPDYPTLDSMKIKVFLPESKSKNSVIKYMDMCSFNVM